MNITHHGINVKRYYVKLTPSLVQLLPECSAPTPARIIELHSCGIECQRVKLAAGTNKVLVMFGMIWIARRSLELLKPSRSSAILGRSRIRAAETAWITGARLHLPDSLLDGWRVER